VLYQLSYEINLSPGYRLSERGAKIQSHAFRTKTFSIYSEIIS